MSKTEHQAPALMPLELLKGPMVAVPAGLLVAAQWKWSSLLKAPFFAAGTVSWMIEKQTAAGALNVIEIFGVSGTYDFFHPAHDSHLSQGWELLDHSAFVTGHHQHA